MYKEKINYAVSYMGVKMVESGSECYKKRVLESYHIQIAYICISQLLFKDKICRSYISHIFIVFPLVTLECLLSGASLYYLILFFCFKLQLCLILAEVLFYKLLLLPNS